MRLFAAGDATSHVMDAPYWHVLDSFPHINLKVISFHAFGQEFTFFTKYQLLMVLAAVLVAAIYIPLAKRVQTGEPPRGAWWNIFESLLTFVRDNVARPYISHHADHYVPFLWTMFLFVLFCNLLGMFPSMGSPTASITVTGVLAMIVFLYIHISGMIENGVVHHFMAFAPHLEMPFVLKLIIIPLLWVIEFLGLGIKCFVLAVRLFANMFAGHMVLATILLFIPAAQLASSGIFWTVTVSSVLGVVALSMLELFVAFLQAFIFTFLTALFLGSTLHPEH